MTIQEINKAYDRIIHALDQKELKNGFDHLQGLIAGCRLYSFQDKLDEIQNTYKYMLRYRMEGVTDPMQAQIYNNLQIACYELADQIRIQALTKDSSRAYFNALRICRLDPYRTFAEFQTALSDNRNPKEQEFAATFLFRKIWTNSRLSSEEYQELKALASHPDTPEWAKCQITSALWLSLQEVFDKDKVELLFDLASVSQTEIRTRALISLLLVLYGYRKRTGLYPQLNYRLQTLAENTPDLSKEIQTIILRFILARETEKISHKLQHEIIPEMMKLNPKISTKMNLQDFNPEQLGDEMNPEWQEKIFADSSLSKKMIEFGELQKEGADIMHSTFIHLKNYPFFRDIANWFVPFRNDHPVFQSAQLESVHLSILDALGVSTYLCNSDKYSLYLSMLDIPEQYRQAVRQQFDAQAADLQQLKSGDMVTPKDQVKIIAGQYIQDLYRFYKLYPAHLDFDDIFSYPLDFHNLPILQPYISDTESLTAIAEYYLQKNYFSDALTIYERLILLEPENDILFQKTGYCRQMLDDIEGALNAYLQADLLNTNSKWVIRRIANCYRTLKLPEKALEYYHRYESLDKDNLSVQISIGHCHLELKNYSEALKYYYKVDYLDNQNHKAWRPIAWCSFLTGKYDQARNYYKKIIEETNPNMHDYLNAGHTEWVMQNIKGALAHYRKAVAEADNDFDMFRKQFEQDTSDLENAGIESEEIPLFLDLLKYTLNGDIQ